MPAPRVHRIEVRPAPRAGDPLGESVLRSARSLGVACERVRTARVYLIRADFSEAQVERIRTALLTDPILEESIIGARPVAPGERTIEVHPLPGVMDPAAQTVRESIGVLVGRDGVEVKTGTRYDFAGLDESSADALARRLLANLVIEAVHFEPWTPADFPRARPADQTLRHVPITTLGDDELLRLSREGHLFLSLAEMRAIQSHYRALDREPTDVELETIAQTWSEHCVHKTFRGTVRYRSGKGNDAGDPINWAGRPGVTVNPDGSITIANLFRSTIAAATHELVAEGMDWTLSVFHDNSGVIAFDDRWAVNVKVETHNRPSAIEPYGGAATGVGGCIRDVLGTGLGAKPIANTDVFCVAFPDRWDEPPAQATGRGSSGDVPCSRAGLVPLPPGVLHPRRVLSRVVDGVRDYGNRVGIPTVNGAVHFDDRYVGNPLVFCGCVGVMPRDKIRGKVRPGDRIIALGGRTGRDGIHGATFSSAEITSAHADEFAHAVQIGNAIEEKRLLDAVLRARDWPASPAPGGGGGRRRRPEGAVSTAPSGGDARVFEGKGGGPLFHALTDCGAGGFSSAIGEMARDLGATVHLDRAPLKYEGLRYDEIWISESQERMILAVPPENVEALRAICAEEGVEMADLGEFGGGGEHREIVLFFKEDEVGRLSCEFLHAGLPMPTREAVWDGEIGKRTAESGNKPSPSRGEDMRDTLLSLLAHPTIASKRWIVRQYDHEVQGSTLIKPLVGPAGVGPGDATVIQPVPGSKQGLAIACGLGVLDSGGVGVPPVPADPYLLALAAVDECVRNLVCVGADPERIAILDNFCWPSCDSPRNMAALVRAAVGCYDAAKAYRTPFVSGKDSLNNQFRYSDPATGREITIEIPPTLLITGVGIVPDVGRCVTMDLKRAGSMIYLLGGPRFSDSETGDDLVEHPRTARLVADLIRRGVVLSCHDCSEGGWLVALAEMLIASSNTGPSPGISLRSFPTPASPRRFAGGEMSESSGRRSAGAGEIRDPIRESTLDPFAELPGRYIVEVPREHQRTIEDHPDLSWNLLGLTDDSGVLTLPAEIAPAPSRQVPAADLRRAFLGTLDW